MTPDKAKFVLRMDTKTQELVKANYQSDNCQSQNEFIDKAVQFYLGYIATEDCGQFLGRSITSTMRGMFDDFENRIARLLFKNAVEINMLMNIVAADRSIDDETVQALRAKCVNDVKRSNGSIYFEDVIKLQRRKD